jgi:hypothetical protein
MNRGLGLAKQAARIITRKANKLCNNCVKVEEEEAAQAAGNGSRIHARNARAALRSPSVKPSERYSFKAASVRNGNAKLVSDNS